MSQEQQAEQSSVTKPSVVSGLGYPADRKEVSADPTGWINPNDEPVTKI